MPPNFYELYKLLNENTVSQELKKADIKDANYKSIEAQTKILVSEMLDVKNISNITKWLIYTYGFHFSFFGIEKMMNINELLSLIKKSGASKEEHNENIEKIMNLANINKTLMAYSDLLYNVRDYILHNTDNNGVISQQLLSKFNSTTFKVPDLLNLSHQYHQNLESRKIKSQGAKGIVILNFPDGYKWVDLKKGYCKIEGKAGRHCGNIGRQNGDTILSLRDNKNFVHLTFILNNGMLVERKAKGNNKPSEEYHSYIIELLKLPIIKGLGKGRYLPQNDFQLNDLSEDHIQELLRARPEFKKFYYSNK